MALVGAYATTDTSALDRQAQGFLSAEKRMRSLQRASVPKSNARIKAAFAAPQNLPDLPFIWSLDPAANRRGRAGYFAKLRREGKLNKGGGRHERTGALEAANEVVFIEQGTGGYFQFENSAGSAFDYVYGDKQVPSHYLTGWPQADEPLQDEADFLEQQIVDDWNYVSVGE